MRPPRTSRTAVLGAADAAVSLAGYWQTVPLVDANAKRVIGLLCTTGLAGVGYVIA